MADHPKPDAGASGNLRTARVSHIAKPRELVRHLGDLTSQQAVELVTNYVDQRRLTSDTLGRVHTEIPSGATRDALIHAYREVQRE